MIEKQKQEILKEFRLIPGVGKSIAEDFWNLISAPGIVRGLAAWEIPCWAGSASFGLPLTIANAFDRFRNA